MDLHASIIFLFTLIFLFVFSPSLDFFLFFGLFLHCIEIGLFFMVNFQHEEKFDEVFIFLLLWKMKKVVD